jgi:DNA-binding MarR family transcriptional regulator
MKMGTTASPWRYDAEVRRARFANLRRSTILRYDSILDYIRRGYIQVRMSKSGPQVPLTPAVFHILLALVGQERHGYDIMQQVKSDSQGAVKMGPGTLYGSLDRMIDAGLVTKGNTQDPRRIYYKLTTLGLATLRAETERLSHLAVVARRQLGTA